MHLIRSLTFWWLFGTFGTLALSATFILGIVTTNRVERFEFQHAEQDLRIKANLVSKTAHDFNPDQACHLQTDVAALNSEIDSRITFLDDRGNVLADSAGNPAIMENHAARPEIVAARQGECPTIIRHSQTTGATTLYAARRVQPGGSPVAFVRVANTVEHIRASFIGLERSIWVGAVGTSFMVVFLGFFLAQGFARPIRDLTTAAARLDNGPAVCPILPARWGELGELSRSLNSASQRLASDRYEIQEARRQIQMLLHGRKNCAKRSDRLPDFMLGLTQTIRLPLSVMKACVETLLDGALDDPANRHEFLNQIDLEADHLHRLVVDALTLCQLQSGEKPLHFETVLLEPLLVECRQRHQDRASARHLRLDLQPPTMCARALLTSTPDGVPRQCPVAVWADEEALVQVLDRLIDEAIDVSSPGGLVQVRWREHANDIVLEVSDTRNDFEDGELSRMFDPCFNLVRTRTSGSGLGLALVKEWAYALGGTVRAERLADQEVTIIVQFPAVNVP